MKHYMTSNKISKIISVIWSDLPTMNREPVKHIVIIAGKGKRNKGNLFKAKSFSLLFVRSLALVFESSRMNINTLCH